MLLTKFTLGMKARSMHAHLEAVGPDVSVVVCTYNRANFLRIALESLVTQTIHKDRYEILVVNNNSTDTTADVAGEFAERSSNCRVIFEPRQGLSHARNRGFAEAYGTYVAYIDDDARAPPDWVEEIVRFIERRPDAKVFGGPYYEYSLEPVPEWLPPSIRSHTLGDAEHILAAHEWIHGCNMVFEKAILEEYGGFNANFGMKGDTIAYGEETELLLRMRADMIAVYYTPKIYVEHIIDSRRFALLWHLKSYYADGKYSTALFNTKSGIASSLYAILKELLAGPVAFFQEKNAPIKRRLYYALKQVFYAMGTLAGIALKKRQSAGTAERGAPDHGRQTRGR